MNENKSILLPDADNASIAEAGSSKYLYPSASSRAIRQNDPWTRISLPLANILESAISIQISMGLVVLDCSLHQVTSVEILALDTKSEAASNLGESAPNRKPHAMGSADISVSSSMWAEECLGLVKAVTSAATLSCCSEVSCG